MGRGPEVLLFGLLLASARSLAFIMVLPLFTRFGLQEGLIRGGILVAFAAPVLPGVIEGLEAAPPPPIALVTVLLVKELFLGLLMGLLLGLPIWAVQAAGDMIDMQRGAMMSDMIEPGSGEQTTVTGTLFVLLTAFVLVAAGWFTEVLLDLLYESYGAWPVLAPLPPLDAAAGAGALMLLDALFETGLVLAIPVFAPLLLTEFAMAVAGKYTQQINVMFLAMSVKQVIYVLILPIYFGALMYYMQGEIRDLGGTLDTLRGFLRP